MQFNINLDIIFQQENYFKRTQRQLHGTRFRQLSEYNFDDFGTFAKPEEAVDIGQIPSKKLTSQLKLRGPYSTLESSVSSLRYINNHGIISVDPMSVNSVILSTDASVRHFSHSFFPRKLIFS